MTPEDYEYDIRLAILQVTGLSLAELAEQMLADPRGLIERMAADPRFAHLGADAGDRLAQAFGFASFAALPIGSRHARNATRGAN